MIRAVVDDAHDPVVARTRNDPTWRLDIAQDVPLLYRERDLGVGPHWMPGIEGESEHPLAGPVRRPWARVRLRERGPGLVPADREDALFVGRAVRCEVVDDGERGVTERAGAMARDARYRPNPERCGCGESVREAAPLEERGAASRTDSPQPHRSGLGR